MNRKLKIIVVVAVLLAALAAAACSLAYRDYQQGALEQSVAVTIPPGAGTIMLSNILSEQGAINYAPLFQLAMRRWELDDIWQPGTYVVAPGSGYLALAELMSQTCYAPDITVTIPEGLQLKEIAKILADNNICERDEFLTACEQGEFAHPFLPAAQADGRVRLEGYLFPDTYRFFADSDPQLVIGRMLDRFGEVVYTEENMAQAAARGYSFDEVITLASVVESEAATQSDRRNIAQVFYNRLETTGSRMMQSCVTVEYALGVHKTIISLADTKVDSPYNTYLHPGLPVGPICCPSLISVQAALWPEQNNYYYFQSDKFGVIWFAATFAEHVRIQNQVQKDWQVVTRIVGE